MDSIVRISSPAGMVCPASEDALSFVNLTLPLKVVAELHRITAAQVPRAAPLPVESGNSELGTPIAKTGVHLCGH
jgi:hypothetical protein